MSKVHLFVATLLLFAFFNLTPTHGGKCLPDVVCQGTKCALDTCCECGSWNPDGSCTSDGWTRTEGTGECDFSLGGGGEISEECACPAKTECQFQKISGDETTTCQCTCWDSEGLCQSDSWEVTEGDGDCDFEVATPPPALPSTPPPPPSESIDDTEECACPPGGTECDDKKYSGDGTVCQCECWDSEGKCLEGAWRVTEGNGDCDFEVPPPEG
ncbi:hypothetical protein BSKO_14167 [Bryopsis sp. KO-2023]|nr:hypothetical protein BSKO_12513 [Bryopsis sp. KO-2023]GMH46199.1 hypothetical protein BSKO_14167 [Bryopsis sp. KO-2023]